MLNIDRALNDDRLMKSVIGLSVSEFNKLEESFREEFQNETWGSMKQELNLGIEKESPVEEGSDIPQVVIHFP